MVTSLLVKYKGSISIIILRAVVGVDLLAPVMVLQVVPLKPSNSLFEVSRKFLSHQTNATYVSLGYRTDS